PWVAQFSTKLGCEFGNMSNLTGPFVRAGGQFQSGLTRLASMRGQLNLRRAPSPYPPRDPRSPREAEGDLGRLNFFNRLGVFFCNGEGFPPSQSERNQSPHAFRNTTFGTRRVAKFEVEIGVQNSVFRNYG